MRFDTLYATTGSEFTGGFATSNRHEQIAAFLSQDYTTRQHELESVAEKLASTRDANKIQFLKALYIMSEFRRFRRYNGHCLHDTIRYVCFAPIRSHLPMVNSLGVKTYCKYDYRVRANVSYKEANEVHKKIKGVQLRSTKKHHGLCVQKVIKFSLWMKQDRPDKANDCSAISDDIPYTLGFIQDRKLSGSMGCNCCLNGGGHTATLQEIDLRSEASVRNFFRVANTQTHYSPLLAGDIFLGGSLLGLRSFLVLSEIFMLAKTAAGMFGCILLDLVLLPFCIAAAVAAPILAVVFSAISLVIEGLFVKPIQAIVRCCKGGSLHQRTADKAISFLSQFKDFQQDETSVPLAKRV